MKGGGARFGWIVYFRQIKYEIFLGKGMTCEKDVLEIQFTTIYSYNLCIHFWFIEIYKSSLYILIFRNTIYTYLWIWQNTTYTFNLYFFIILKVFYTHIWMMIWKIFLFIKLQICVFYPCFLTFLILLTFFFKKAFLRR